MFPLFAPQVGARLVGLDEAIEMIDVGGVALLGAAARNAAGVAAVADPIHYPAIVREIRERGHVSAALRARLAAEAFSVLAAYHAPDSLWRDAVKEIRAVLETRLGLAAKA